MPDASTPDDCHVCDGTGIYPVNDANGFYLYDIDCPECGAMASWSRFVTELGQATGAHPFT